MLCDKCNSRKAHVHVVQTVNNNTVERYLCQICAIEFQPENSPFSFSVHEFLKGVYTDKVPADEQLTNKASKTCSGCGQTYGDYQQTGLFGCAECYRTFRFVIMPLSKRIQGSVQHIGKIPLKLVRVHRFERNRQQLQLALKDAVQHEAYEKAAELRDQIQLLDQKIQYLKEGKQ